MRLVQVPTASEHARANGHGHERPPIDEGQLDDLDLESAPDRWLQ